MNVLTSLGRAEVFSGSWCARTSATSFLDAQGASLNVFALQSLFRSVGLLVGYHLDETESTRLLGMRVKHDRAVLDIAVFFEEAGDIGLGKTRMNSSHEKVRATVERFVIVVSVLHASVGRRRWSSQKASACIE